MVKKTIVVVGAGKGLGNNVAKIFGDNDFRVVLVSRCIEKLNQYKTDFESKGIETHVYSADCEKPKELTSTFNKIQNEFGCVDVLVYNTCILESGIATTFDNDNFMRHYQVDVASALLCTKLVLKKQEENKKGTIIFTGGIFGDNPIKEYTGVSVGKAALKALGKTLHDELKEKGIFVGLITITDAIQPDTKHSPELIAQKYWEMYQKQDKYEYVY